MVDLLEGFVIDNEALPTAGHSGESAQALYQWLSECRRKYESGQLAPRIAERLNQLHPLWSRQPQLVAPAFELTARDISDKVPDPVVHADRLNWHWNNLELLKQIDELRGSENSTPHLWFLELHTGRLNRRPTSDEIEALEQYARRSVPLERIYPLRMAKKTGELIRSDVDFVENALALGENLLVAGQWPMMVSSPRKYFEKGMHDPRARNQQVSQRNIQLGIWLRDQRKLNSAGDLWGLRVSFLDLVAPQWDERRFKRESFEERVREFWSVLGGLSHPWPKMTAPDRRERTAAFRLSQWRKARLQWLRENTRRREDGLDLIPVPREHQILDELFGSEWGDAKVQPNYPSPEQIHEVLGLDPYDQVSSAEL